MPQSRKRRTVKRRPNNAALTRKAAASSDGKISNRNKVIAAIIIFAIVAAGVVYLLVPGLNAPTAGAEVTTPSGLKYTDIVVGTGPSPQPGQIVVVHYTGTLTNGTKFDSSRDKGQPYQFPIGRGTVIKGWDEGVMTMKVGGRRRLVLPPSLGYGDRGSPPNIPPKATLIFDVELLGIK